jgi:hypothetical protein
MGNILRTYYAKSEFEHYTFRASNISDARYWIINHLDCSQEWTLEEVINPTRKPIDIK